MNELVEVQGPIGNVEGLLASTLIRVHSENGCSVFQGRVVLTVNVQDENARRRVPARIRERRQDIRNRSGLACASCAYDRAVPRDKTVDVDQRRDGLCARETAYANIVRSVRLSVDPAEVFFRNEVRLISNGRVLGDTPSKLTGPMSLTNELDPQPPVTIGLGIGQGLRNSSRSRLRHDSKEVRESDGHPDKAADLSDAIPMTVNEGEA